MTVFFTADLHFGHDNIIKYCNRPFDSVEEMNEGLVERWNATVNTNDLVYILGDVCMGKVRESLLYVERLNGTKVLVPGNHDRCHPSLKGAAKWQQIYTDHGLFVAETMLLLNHSNIDFFCCHFPPVGDSRHQDRYVELRPTVPKDMWVLHGHVHDIWKRNGTCINVGVDVWDYRPVRFDTLVGVAWDVLK